MNYEIQKLYVNICLFVLKLTNEVESKTMNMKHKIYGHEEVKSVVKIEVELLKVD